MLTVAQPPLTYAADENNEDSCASDKDYKSDDEDVNASDNDLNANEEWDEDDDSSDSHDDDDPSDGEYDLNDGMESDGSSSTDDNESDHGDAFERENQNDHFAIPANEPGEEESVNADELHDQDVERVNIVADDSEEDNDVIEDAPRPDHQRQERSQRRRSRRNDSSSNTGKSGMANELKSNLGNYWADPAFAVNCHTIDHTDGTSPRLP